MAKKKTSCAGLLGLGFLVILALAVVGQLMPTSRKSSRAETTGTVNRTVGKEVWYAGGTLHEATMAEWRSATRRNKIATAADFVANYVKARGETLTDFSVGGTTYRAVVGLVACIDEGGADQSQMEVSEIAVACMILTENL